MSLFLWLCFFITYLTLPFLQIFDNRTFYVIIVAAFDESVKSYSGYTPECFTGQYRFLQYDAMQAGNTRRGHWFATHTVAVNMAMTKERLINSGFYDLATAYQSVHVNY